MSLSNQLRDRARRVMAGGGIAGSSFFVSAEGVRLRTAEGGELVDFTAAGGSLILGCGDEDVVRAVKTRAELGLYPGLRSEDGVRLAELLVSFVTFLDRVVLSASESGAVSSAVDLSRTVTGKSSAIFAGGSAKTKPSAGGTRIPYNDLDAAGKVFESLKGTVAAVVVEPISTEMGLAEPSPGFLKGLRDLCDAEGALLVFDERISAFRFGLSDYASFCGIRPDLLCFGGIIGGGFPIGAFGGRREVFKEAEAFAVEAVHPAALAAGSAVLLKLERTDPYDRLDLYARRIGEELDAFAKESGMDFRVARSGGVFSPFFRREAVATEADADECDVRRYGLFARRLLDRGWLVPASQFTPCFVSAAHEDEDIDGFIEACRLTLDEVFEAL